MLAFGNQRAFHRLLEGIPKAEKASPALLVPDVGSIADSFAFVSAVIVH